MARFRFFAILIGLIAAAFPARADEVPLEAKAEVTSLAPARPFWIAVQITPRPGAVLPWFDPETGDLSISIEISGRAGFTAGETILPAPELDPADGIYRYEGTFWALQEVLVPDDLPRGGAYTVRGGVRWLGCLDTCAERFGTFALTLPSGRGEANGDTAELFSTLRANAPGLLPWPVRLEAEGGQATLKVYLEPSHYPAISFLPETGGNKSAFAAFQDFDKTRDGFAASFPERDFAGEARIAGLLFAEGPDGPEVFRLAVANLAEPQGLSAPPPAPPIGLMLALAFAFLGGIILNLMPCVFPILSLKAFQMVKSAHRSRLAFARDGFAYTFGILVSFALVALILLTFRAGGEAVGWGFQLQSPAFVTAMAVLMVVVAFNFAGGFSISLPLALSGGPKGGGFNEAFLTGALTTLLATPCTAPFMAPALGLALTLPTGEALLVFLTLGFGLAFPYLAVSLMPGVQRLIPRPGPWLERFRKILAYPLLATAGWLLWVLYQQAGRSGLLAALVFMSLAAWWMVAWKYSKKMKSTARAALLSLLALAAIGVVTWLSPNLETKAIKTPAEARAFSAQRLAELRLQGKGVFVNFTARWCLTCLVNERLVFDRDEFQSFLAENGIVYLVADWTNPDPEIAGALAGLGRSALPVYAFYPPGGPAKGVVLLPEVLTLDGAIERIEAAMTAG
jgi:cytochrome c biogenesis protein CcdA/DsbC/DsbD-like thiol-disulfide interchange protein